MEDIKVTVSVRWLVHQLFKEVDDSLVPEYCKTRVEFKDMVPLIGRQLEMNYEGNSEGKDSEVKGTADGKRTGKA